jgi:hypothetical protein
MGWKTVGNTYETSRRYVMGVPEAAGDEDTVRELWIMRRKEKALERVIKNRLRLCKVDDQNPIREEMRYQLRGRQNDWVEEGKKKMEQLGMGNTWSKGQMGNVL